MLITAITVSTFIKAILRDLINKSSHLFFFFGPLLHSLWDPSSLAKD